MDWACYSTELAAGLAFAYIMHRYEDGTYSVLVKYTGGDHFEQVFKSREEMLSHLGQIQDYLAKRKNNNE